ncbi:MAG: hypothetical protein ABIF10_03380 [Candidatus Woesearchaeota archaeon]
MNLKCLFGFHKWEKYGGPINRGNGMFEQKLVCTRCRKIRRHIS